MAIAAELDLASKLDLISTESKLEKGTVIYSVENSSLSTVNAGFPRIEGRSLINWIDLFARGCKVRILELGGGVHQKAAIEILEKYRDSSNIELVGLEPRPLANQAKDKLSKFENYNYVKGEVSKLPNLEIGKFDIIFAHHVLEQVETDNPLKSVKQISKLLNPGGVLFCDRALLYKGIAEKLADSLKKQGISIEYSYALTESELRKTGIIRTNIAIRVHDNYPEFQVIEGQQIVDFSGRKWPTKECDLVAC
ncbi:MAG: class I SAM-dependent methyltransferase [Candidatus Levybacteria bacterium]|nr:class I SAM-dependent methyltransferase [Candidatus Levybacteria bacterium]